MVYKWAIEKRVKEKIQDRNDILDKDRFAETYLNFNNISIIPHYGKTTATLLIDLCKYIKLDFFVINDWDFEEDFIADLSTFPTKSEMKTNYVRYLDSTDPVIKGKITTNWKLINKATL
jgi:hypothetical protein